MAHLNGNIFLTRKQIDVLKKGKAIRFRREGKWITIGVKNDAEAKLKAKINFYRNKLIALKKKEVANKQSN